MIFHFLHKNGVSQMRFTFDGRPIFFINVAESKNFRAFKYA